MLIGDAAGYNDPIAAQGLSIALRDARIVRDLVLDGARTPDAFAPYGAERMARMKRVGLIAEVLAATHAEDAENRAARRCYFAEKAAAADPEVVGVVAGVLSGPETMPDELLRSDLVDRIRAQ